MANFNKVILLGNLTRDPELRYTQSGTAVCKIGLAVNRTYTANGEKQESTTFVDCTAWGRTGEVINEYCKKGRPLLVEGRLEFSEWEGKDGGKRSKLEVVIENFQFIGGRDDSGGGGRQSNRPKEAAAAPAGGDSFGDVPF